MWIFMSGSFLSIVASRGVPGELLVRGRAKGDIERVFKDARVKTTPANDYRFRAWIPAPEVVKVIAAQICAIDYDNFKASVKEADRHDAYFSVWSAMNNFQSDRARHRRRK
jgi:hypothetical protein